MPPLAALPVALSGDCTVAAGGWAVVGVCLPGEEEGVDSSREGDTAARKTATPAAAAAAKLPIEGRTMDEEGGGGCRGNDDGFPRGPELVCSARVPFCVMPFPKPTEVLCCSMAADVAQAWGAPAAALGLLLGLTPLEAWLPEDKWVCRDDCDDPEWFAVGAALVLPVRPPKSAPRDELELLPAGKGEVRCCCWDDVIGG